MNSLLGLLDNNRNIHYAVINPEDCTLYDVSPSLLEMTGEESFKGRLLSELLGCTKGLNCSNSAVRVDMTGRDKVIHFTECKHLNKNFFVIKFKTHIEGAEKHIVLFTENDIISRSATLFNDLDRIMQHEIRNVLSNLNILTDNIEGDLEESRLGDIPEMVEMTKINIDVVNKLLGLQADIKNDILRSSSANIKSKPLNVVVEEILKDQKAMALKKNLLIKVTGDKSCLNTDILAHLNSGLMYLLFSNLINNSLKYAPPSTEILIDYTCTDTHMTIVVSNCGELEDEVAADFFSKYAKGSTSSGTGLGTYCCKLITELCKGKIEMSDKNGMVAVTVTLPLNPF